MYTDSLFFRPHFLRNARDTQPAKLPIRLLVVTALLFCCWPTHAPAEVIAIDAARIETTIQFGYWPSLPGLFGQTFTAPPRAVTLNHFDFRMHLAYDLPDEGTPQPNLSLPFRLRGYIARWNPVTSTIAGPVLYSSAPLDITKPAPIDDSAQFDVSSFQLLTFHPRALPVQDGHQYVAFVTALGLTHPATGAGLGLGTLALSYCGYDFCEEYSRVGVNYAGGHLIIGEVFGPQPSDAFLRTDTLLDAAFRASFDSAAPVPEPSSIILVSAAAFLGWAHRRRSRVKRYD